jgi:hypothetical protein
MPSEEEYHTAEDQTTTYDEISNKRVSADSRSQKLLSVARLWRLTLSLLGLKSLARKYGP